ncbi:DUF461 domain-containing protein, partial [Streptomyces sp. NPDC006356]
DNASATLPSSREAIQDGNAQKITFTFSKTGDVSLRAFVVPAEHHFESWGPSEVPAAPGTSASPSSSPTGTPAGGTEATPTGAASAGETPGAGAEAGTGAGTGAGAATPSDSTSQSVAGH